MAKKAAAAAEEVSSPSFEECLQELQQIVGQLESGSTGLEETLRQFERGVHLLGQCQRLLSTAEQRIEVLTGFKADGTPVTEPFQAAASWEEGQTQIGAAATKRSLFTEE